MSAEDASHGPAEPAVSSTERSAPARDAAARICPYVGLRAFDSEHAHLFFGRSDQIDELIQRLATQRFLAVLGASGSGKSSLVRAGLLPALRSDFLDGAGPRWRALTMRPGSSPFDALAEVLAELREESGGSASAPPSRGSGTRPTERARDQAPAHDVAIAEIGALLRHSPRGLVDAVRELHADRDDNFLLIVDQFEELFRLGRELRDRAAWKLERRDFVERLLQAAQEPELPFYVVITMRTDFLGECAEFRGLPEAMNAGQYLVPYLTRMQLELAVRGPMDVSNQPISRALVRRIVTDAERWIVSDERHSADALPVMQHALMRTWHARQGSKDAAQTLGLEHYDLAQGRNGALDRHAEELFQSFEPEEKKAAEVLLRRISRLSSDGRVTRDPTPFGQILALARSRGIDPEAVRRVVDRLRHPDAAFLTPPLGAKLLPETDIDVTHEALLRNWTTLTQWNQAERRGALTYSDIVSGERQFVKGEGQRLAARRLSWAVDWWRAFLPTAEWASRYHELDEAASKLDLAARADWHRKRFEAARKFLRDSQLRGWIRVGTLAVLAVLVLVSIALGANSQTLRVARDRAEQAQRTAEAEREKARAAQQKAEDERQKAVAALVDAESARLVTEVALRVAEDERGKADAARRTAEAERNAAREEREKANKLRNVAETERQKTQSALSRAESEREKAEQATLAERAEKQRVLDQLRLANANALAAESLEQSNRTLRQQLDQCRTGALPRKSK